LPDRDYVVLDEVQRAPTLLSAIKKTIDEDRRPGRFLLTGSANLMALPTVAESLAGRMETLRLLPLSQAEVLGTSANWVDAVFRGRITGVAHSLVGTELRKAVLKGGYPEMLSRDAERRRKAWARQYMDAIIQRDVQNIAEVDKLAQMPALLRALAHHSGHVCSYNRLGNDVGLSHKSAERYVGILENMFLLHRVSIIENAAGELVGIEVKSKATIRSADLRGLKRLAARVGARLKQGILLYDGTETLPLGDGYTAAPLSTLWGEQ
jgi:predicted AAA+ superfamily ATPase